MFCVSTFYLLLFFLFLEGRGYVNFLLAAYRWLLKFSGCWCLHHPHVKILWWWVLQFCMKSTACFCCLFELWSTKFTIDSFSVFFMHALLSQSWLIRVIARTTMTWLISFYFCFYFYSFYKILLWIFLGWGCGVKCLEKVKN